MTKLLLALALLLLPLAARAAPDLPDLPKGTLVELPAAGGNDTLVVILSGDGGWADLDKQLGAKMSERGYAVVGIDCLKYFWETRSPDQTARDLNAVLDHYLAAWGKAHVVLIGYSFGGAVAPFIMTRMTDPLRARIALAALLSTGTYANWEIHWGDWLHDKPHKSAKPVAQELAKVKGVKTLCVYGAEEADSALCPTLPAASAEILKLPGGHHFDEDYAKLAELILKRVPGAE